METRGFKMNLEKTNTMVIGEGTYHTIQSEDDLVDIVEKE